jgi:hypothetical protein
VPHGVNCVQCFSGQVTELAEINHYEARPVSDDRQSLILADVVGRRKLEGATTADR